MILTLPDNSYLPNILGNNNENIQLVAKALDVSFHYAGNSIHVEGKNKLIAIEVIKNLYNFVKNNGNPSHFDIQMLIEEAKNLNLSVEQSSIITKNLKVLPKTPKQSAYIKTIDENLITFATGVAGGGKTYLATIKAVEYLQKGKVERIILTRPAVEAGEHLGFLPGDFKEKVNPYLRPLFDALNDVLTTDEITKRLENHTLEMAPMAFMRGRTFSNAFILLDEAQNTTVGQMKMFLTRLGFNSKMVITGDTSQSDLAKTIPNGLNYSIKHLKNIKNIAFVEFLKSETVRNPIIQDIINAFNND